MPHTDVSTFSPSRSDAPLLTLCGRPLRHLLTVTLDERGPLSVAELAAAVGREGFALPGRSSKTISDALRWEIRHGRVVRLDRGRYAVGTMLRQTRRWVQQRVDRLRTLGAHLAEE